MGVLASQEVIERRLALCGGCDEQQVIPIAVVDGKREFGVRVCRQCSCVVPLKARLAASKCPLGKY
jgi:hypothetical protein